MDVTESFEANRDRLRGVAYRMLGSLSEADDAVQEAWLRLSRADTAAVANLAGWLTTVVARVCLDMLRARKSRREEPIAVAAEPSVPHTGEREAILADSVGLALLVVLDTLAPAERLAFVLHDMFGVGFDEIGEVVGRTPTAARQLASRARRRVQGLPADRDDYVDRSALMRQRAIVDKFLAAMRAGDFEGIVAVLDPDVVVTTDVAGAHEVRGARNWAKGAVVYSKGAKKAVRPALVNGSVGLVLAPHGKLVRALTFTFVGDVIATIEVVMQPERLAALELGILDVNPQQLD
jgi:RNA polymerase sigma factor (sigma-70 family)